MRVYQAWNSQMREWRRYTIVDLLSSAEKGDVEWLDKIVNSGVDINTTTKGGSSVLHFAASNRQIKMIYHLIGKYPLCLDKGKSFDPQGYTALHHAARLGMTSICEALVAKGFEREKTTADGRSILDLAKEAKQTHMIEYLEKTAYSSYNHGETNLQECRAEDEGLSDMEQPDDNEPTITSNETDDADDSTHMNEHPEKSAYSSYIYVKTGRSIMDDGYHSFPKGPTPPVSLMTAETVTGDRRKDACDVVPSVRDDISEDSLDVAPLDRVDIREDSREVVPLVRDDVWKYSRGIAPPVAPEDSFKKWIGLHRSAAAGNSLDVIKMIENGADAMKKINSVFFPNIDLKNKEMLTPMEVAFYSKENEMVGLLVSYTDEEIVRKCLSKCEDTYLETKPYIVKGILRKKYKDKCIDIVFGELHPEKLKMFVIYTKTIIHGSETTESGYRVLFRDPTVSSDEGRKVLRHSHEQNYILSDADRGLVAQSIKQHSDKLWNDHSNLRGIMSSPVKSVGGNFTKKTCLVILCHFKGFVPDNEPLFPREIQIGNDVLPVDVREGQVALHHVMCPDALHTPLSFGCNIGSADDYTTRFGTVGPFVQLNDDKIGFITCAHVVYGNYRFVGDSLPDITVLQPSNGDTAFPEEARICGKVVNLKYSLNEDTSIDVAVVEITVPERKPSSPGFAAYSQEQLTGRGISENIPLFNHGECGEPTVGREVVKFGSASGVTYGTYRGIETSEFSSKLYGRTSETERWRGVYYIENRQCQEKDCQLPPFSTPGDSGAGVFQVRDDNSLICVGILVGADTATGSGIVIPIKPILEEFNLTLKIFQPQERLDPVLQTS
ncbi:uncharacterized protein LOC110466973 isoform X2 [Mizuhopecten yessoensis]|uniref:uncharacterized protein LOC110466973 isoform X2 n=1 Tax=Mizuhopecten yessoensis TaxID=6573 RepID=UPI000B45EDBC|nr:uncharacterized protein LOC110466973 isoform X2 [Mizuhopecten yessoensis]